MTKSVLVGPPLALPAVASGEGRAAGRPKHIESTCGADQGPALHDTKNRRDTVRSGSISAHFFALPANELGGRRSGRRRGAPTPVRRLQDRRPTANDESVGRWARHRAARAFTLVELIVVMVLLLIVASMVAPRMSSFFRGQALSGEARRMLSLINYAQSRAVAEGVPVLLWINPANSTYGIEVQAGHAGSDTRQQIFTAEPTLTLEAPGSTDTVVSEQEDEQLGLPAGLPAIRFNPDGFFDEGSISKIVIRQGEEGALEIVPTATRLGYEILPTTRTN